MGEATWYYTQSGQQAGPVPFDALRGMARSGQLARTELIWTEGMSQWQPAGATAGLFDGVGAAAPPAAYAGFWARFAAIVLDGLLYLLVIMFAGVITAAAAAGSGAHGIGPAQAQAINGLGVLGMWLYFALMESSTAQGTLGKLALGLKVTNLDGQRVGLGRASVRHFARLIAVVGATVVATVVIGIAVGAGGGGHGNPRGNTSPAILLGLSGFLLFFGIVAASYVMQVFTARRQALHDLVAGTLVLKK